MVKLKRSFSYERFIQFLLRPLPQWVLKRLGHLAFSFELYWIMGKLRPFLGTISRDPEYRGVERFLEYPWVLDKLLPAKRGIQVLDVGCGPSLLFCEPIRRGYEVCSVDLVPPPLAGRYPKWCFVQADATNTPFKENTFDYILSISAVEHIGSDFRWMREFSRILKENGVALITVPVESRQLCISPTKLMEELINKGLSPIREEYYKRRGKRWDEISLAQAEELYQSSGRFKLAPAVACLTLGKAVDRFFKRQ